MTDNNKNNYLKDQIKLIEQLFRQNNFNQMIIESKKTLKLFPNNLAILNAMALAYKNLGNFKKAKEVFLDILNLDIDSKFAHIYSNAGNLFMDLGELNKSIECHEITLNIDKSNINSLTGIGLCFMNLGKSEEAISYFKKALEVDPKNDSAHNNIANIYRIQNRFKEAIDHYELSNHKLSKSNQLECIYKDNNKEYFNEKLEELIKRERLEPLVAALSSHAAIKFSQKDKYPFCPDPLNYIYNFNLYEDDRFNDELIKKVAEEINQAKIEKKTQSLLINGFQSSGNLFLQNLPNIKILETIIVDCIERYKKIYSNCNVSFIDKWPIDYNLYGWLIIMKKGGNLMAHMHKEGWLSGSLYLNVPKKNSKEEGNIKFSLHGGDFPYAGENFTEKIVDIKKGTIVLFPSSIFHSTIPFESDEERITLAFDILPKI